MSLEEQYSKLSKLLQDLETSAKQNTIASTVDCIQIRSSIYNLVSDMITTQCQETKQIFTKNWSN